ncbi:MAG: Bug family tripartite tricarboxylate transporter substrate binding protein [Burkholderiales bacterium]
MRPLHAAALMVTTFVSFIHAPLAAAQAWPAKPVRLIVNSAAGASVDLIARAFSQRLGATLGQPIIVDNRAGGGGTIGIRDVAKAPADGYTLLHSAGSLFVFGSHMKGLDFDIATEVEPIATTARNTILLVARPDLGANNVADLMAMARANPGKLNFGSGSLGLQAATEMMLLAAKVRATNVPYKSVAQMVTDLVGGQIDFALEPGTSIAHAKAGKLRLLAAVSSVRSSALPDLPTLAQAGVEADAGTITVIGLYGPAKLPGDIAARLNAEVGKIMQTPEARSVLSGIGSDPINLTPTEFSAMLRRDRDRYGAVIREANIRIE